MKTIFYQAIAILLLAFSCAEKEQTTAISIIPQPKEVIKENGKFTFNKDTKICISNEAQRPISEMIQQKFKKVAGWDLAIVKQPVAENSIVFENVENLDKEGYQLIVGKNKITLKASEYSGFLYAWESLRQLLPNTIESSSNTDANWYVPTLTINDAPRFVWRGLMLDVSRHFFPKEYVIKTLDRLALLKMNTLHLHLVDDQGWRIEIKKYPKLTEVGAWRVDREDLHWNDRAPQKKGEKATYGGFYTQEDIKEIIAHASKLGITVVPEIEMPAHVTCAIAAYPEFSCQGKAVTVPPGGVWPITDIYCAGNEKTFAFLEDVLSEVMELFPSKYIHVGGDEATKTNWEKCRKCKARMRKEGLKNVEELQSYFIKRMERFISSKGRVLIGWDEILEGGLAPGATVMSWRGVKGGLEASEQGHDVVMTPGSHCYFDHYQGEPDNEPLAIGGYTTLSKVYEFDPVVDTMSNEQAQHVLGGQANLWAEYIPTQKHSEYMIFPRLLALSETLWSPKESRNKEDFFRRILHFMNKLDIMGINYAKSAFDITAKSNIDDNGNISMQLSNEFPGTKIYYSLNDKNLSENSNLYKEPIKLNETTVLYAAAFKNGKISGKVLSKTFNFHKAVGKDVTYTKKYDKRYEGQGGKGLVNILRGTLNFHDGQWQGWEGEDMEVIIDLKKPQEISKVTVGSMENQGSHIYFPTKVEVWVSKDGKHFTSAGKISRKYAQNGYALLKDFTIAFSPETVQYVKVKATNLKDAPNTSDSWLFVDEIIVE